MLSTRFNAALDLAASLHAQQYRKGGRIPYVSHLLAVSAIVLEFGGNETQAIAALLHDAVEDQGGAMVLAQIREQFGEEVAAIVESLSDTDQHPKPPWQERKRQHLEQLQQAPDSAFLVLAADKLHNARTTVREYRQIGEAIWGRFGGGRSGALWYYRQMQTILQPRLTAELNQEIESVLSELEELISRQQQMSDTAN